MADITPAELAARLEGLAPCSEIRGFVDGRHFVEHRYQIDGAFRDTLIAALWAGEKMREALNAIIDRGPERDVKWAGMSLKDIAIFALSPAAIVRSAAMDALIAGDADLIGGD